MAMFPNALATPPDRRNELKPGDVTRMYPGANGRTMEQCPSHNPSLR